MKKGKTTSNVSARDALATLLQNGFELAVDETGRRPRPTERGPKRETRGKVNAQTALTSLSGKSVYLSGEHRKTGTPVTVFLLPKGMLTLPALDTLRDKTGLDF